MANDVCDFYAGADICLNYDPGFDTPSDRAVMTEATRGRGVRMWYIGVSRRMVLRQPQASQKRAHAHEQNTV